MNLVKIIPRRLLCSLALLCLNSNLAANEDTLTFGIVPQQPPAKMYTLWQPLLEEVSRQTGIKLLFKTAKDIPTFEKAMRRGEYDLAYMNPYHYAVFSEFPGYNALVAKKPGQLVGMVVVRNDSSYQSLEDLEGERMVFPSPAAFAASLITRQELARRDINIEVAYVRSHDSVYLNVVRGFAEAGGGVGRTLASTDAEVRDSLRVLWRSKGFLSHPVAANSRVPLDSQAKIQRALIGLSQTHAGSEMLAKLRIKAFGEVTDADYDAIRILEWNGLEGTIDPSID